MTVTNSVVDWDEVEDRDILAQFLATRTGSRLIPKLAESVPGLLGSGDTNSVLIRSGEVRGWQDALRTLLELAVRTKKPDSTPLNPEYPPLEDDTQWAPPPK